MQAFVSDREALDYLSGRIAAEAAREGVPLSEVERKMLYFSETDWTLPEMAAVSDEFNQAYDEDEYVQRIAGLIRKIEAHGHSGDPEERKDWNRVVEKLSGSDRYIQVMLNPSFMRLGPTVRPPHDRFKLWLTAFTIVFGFFGSWALLNWLFGSKLWVFQDWIADHGGGKLYVTLGVLLILVLSRILSDLWL